VSTAPSLKGEVHKFSLKVTKGPHAGLSMEFEKSMVTIGRSAENDIQLNLDVRVSRHHVEIRQSMGQFYIANLSQKNFVLLNGQNITSEKIDNRGVFQLGESEFMLHVHIDTDMIEPLSLVTSNQSLVKSSVVPRPVISPYQPPAQPLAQATRPSLQSNTQPRPRPNATTVSSPSLFENKKFKIYAGLAMLGLFIFMSLPKTKSRRADDRVYRSIEEIDLSRQEAENEIKVFKDRKDKMQQTIYQKSNENFLRGYRDYRQAQYARAKEAFQVVLNLDPDNELAKRYYNLAQIKLDELIKFHMLQGRRYFEKQNYRLCKSNYQTAMTMLASDLSNPEYKEAKFQHERCSVAQEGRQ
jgi:hypothetical protein